MEMANYILKILQSNLSIVWSWGFNSPRPINNGLIFNVNGFIHQGAVCISYIYDTDNFTIQLINRHNEVCKEISGVYIDNLIDVIDLSVERVSNYSQRVRKEYNL